MTIFGDILVNTWVEGEGDWNFQDRGFLWAPTIFHYRIGDSVRDPIHHRNPVRSFVNIINCTNFARENNNFYRITIYSSKANYKEYFSSTQMNLKRRIFCSFQWGLNQWPPACEAVTRPNIHRGMIENAGNKIFLHISVDVWSGDRLARRRSLVQTPLKGAKISAFSGCSKNILYSNFCYVSLTSLTFAGVWDVLQVSVTDAFFLRVSSSICDTNFS